MKFSFVNGWMNPKFTVYDKFNRVVYKCTFSELNQDGMIESHEEITIQRTDLNYTLKEYFLGYRIHFTFYYNQFVNLETMNKFKTLIDFQRSVNEGSPYKIFLTPNEENVSRRFEVLFSNESIDIGVIKSGRISLIKIIESKPCIKLNLYLWV